MKTRNGDWETRRHGDERLADVDEMPAEPRTIPTSREAASQSKNGDSAGWRISIKGSTQGQGGRERAWAPIPSRLQRNSNAEWRMRNGRTSLPQIRMLQVTYIKQSSQVQGLRPGCRGSRAGSGQEGNKGLQPSDDPRRRKRYRAPSGPQLPDSTSVRIEFVKGGHSGGQGPPREPFRSARATRTPFPWPQGSDTMRISQRPMAARRR